MPLLPRTAGAIAAAAAILATLTPSVASAQVPGAGAATIGIVNETSLPRLDKSRRPVQKRPLTLTPEAVSLQDCVDDQLIRFTLQMAGFEANASVEAWASNAGQECTQPTARGGGVQQCWRILDSGIPLQTTTDVEIPVRRIMSGAPPFLPTAPDATENACGKVNLSTITVHFLYFAPGNQAVAASSKNVAVTVDTVGPKPPSGLKALPGNTRIQVSWVNISGGTGDASATGGLTELTGVNVYCDPAGGSPTPTTTRNPAVCHEEIVDASIDDSGDAMPDSGTVVEVCEDGGTSTSTDTSAGSCSSSNLSSPGEPIFPTADFNAKFLCGTITGNTGTTVVADNVGGNPLANGTVYAVSVAATDRFGNVGELSDPICQTPNVTTDFWDDYRKAGGQAGGGCATGGTPPLGSLGVLALIGLSAALSRGRTRRRSRR
jgi:hypothetical protein